MGQSVGAAAGQQPVDSGMTFGQRFVERSREYGTLCVGIDPHVGLLQQWGLPVSVDGLKQFTDICVEAFVDTACVVKPQVAFYEAFGAAGFAVLEEAIRSLRGAGVLVISDAKRGDIGSTMEGYAQAWLAPGAPLESDAVTVSPYLGFGALEAVFALADEHNKGAIVLAATSNPEALGLQNAPMEGVLGSKVKISQDICDAVAKRNAPYAQARNIPGNLGVVVGATLQDPPELSQVNGVILMPGVGAQGGSAADVKRISGSAFHLVSPNVSRSVLSAGPDVARLRAAIDTQQQELL